MFILRAEYQWPQHRQFMGSRQPQPGIIWGEARPGPVVVTSCGKHGFEGGYAIDANSRSERLITIVQSKEAAIGALH